jgi:transcriptional regulator with XRE-family HTH domain
MATRSKKGGRKRAKTRAAKRGAGRRTGTRAARAGHPGRSRAARNRRSSPAGTVRAVATRPRPRSLADRLAGIFERAAVAALRRRVDVGDHRGAAWRRASSGMRRETGAYLRELRELAGLTVDELAAAVDLRDKKLIEAVEAGTAALSFELVLRLAAVLARHDPLPFVSRMVRSHNPVLWEILEDWGLGRLPIQLERERSFVNLLRGHDEARMLSDEEFADLLELTRAAFELGLGFGRRKRSGRSARAAPRSSSR